MVNFEPATNGCPRCRCAGCDEEMIHRDHRKFYESSSGFGQIISRDFGHGPFGWADVDLVLERAALHRDQLPLLMVFEHKETSSKVSDSQQKILRRWAIIVHLAIVARKLDPNSGVYTVRGRIAGLTTGYRETYFDGAQVIERILPRLDAGAKESWIVGSQNELFSWIDARLGVVPKDRRWR